jgi:hypothetical protein
VRWIIASEGISLDDYFADPHGEMVGTLSMISSTRTHCDTARTHATPPRNDLVRSLPWCLASIPTKVLHRDTSAAGKQRRRLGEC